MTAMTLCNGVSLGSGGLAVAACAAGMTFSIVGGANQFSGGVLSLYYGEEVSGFITRSLLGLGLPADKVALYLGWIETGSATLLITGEGFQILSKSGKSLARIDKVPKQTLDEIKAANAKIKNGRKHSGFYKNYSNRSIKEIQKGINSIEKQIKLHSNKISDPKKYISNWNKLDPRQRSALINKKWPSDIKRLREERNILRRILKEKGKTHVK